MVGAWISPDTPVYAGTHSQPGRLVRQTPRRSTLSGDRLMGIDGLGLLGPLGEDSLGTDEDLESDPDYGHLVDSILKFGTKVIPSLMPLVTGLALKHGIDLQALLGMAQQRAAGSPPASGMPTWGWVAIGVGAVVLLGGAFVAGSGRRR